MRVVFMGTPAAAVPALRALDGAFDVVAVYTRPDKPKGRGRRLEPSPVKSAATELELDVRQPKTLKAEAGALRALDPDVIAVVAYGAILRPDVLAVPRLGCVNVHFSLLPRWRGAAPVERAILAGDERSGVTTMLMDEGLDTGDILSEEIVPIRDDDTTGSLTGRLAGIGAPLLVRTLNELDDGEVVPRRQPADGATYAEKVSVDEARIDPVDLAVVGERKTRAFDPSPGAYVTFRGKRLKVWRACVEPGTGEVGAFVDGALQTTDGRLRFVEVQPEGKRRMSGDDFARGYHPKDGETID